MMHFDGFLLLIACVVLAVSADESLPLLVGTLEEQVNVGLAVPASPLRPLLACLCVCLYDPQLCNPPHCQ